MDDPRLDSAVKLFKGNCLGVALYRRGLTDPHVCFGFIVEDDENWFPDTGNTASSFWLPDLEEQIAAVKVWMEANCELDGAWGYKFKETSHGT